MPNSTASWLMVAAGLSSADVRDSAGSALVASSFGPGLSSGFLGSVPEGDPIAEPTCEPRLVDLAAGYGEHCVDGVVGVGMLVVP